MKEIDLLKRVFDPRNFKWASKWRRIALFYQILAKLKDEKRITVIKSKIKLIL